MVFHVLVVHTQEHAGEAHRPDSIVFGAGVDGAWVDVVDEGGVGEEEGKGGEENGQNLTLHLETGVEMWTTLVSLAWLVIDQSDWT